MLRPWSIRYVICWDSDFDSSSPCVLGYATAVVPALADLNSGEDVGPGCESQAWMGI